jgi:hypothetical protein
MYAARLMDEISGRRTPRIALSGLPNYLTCLVGRCPVDLPVWNMEARNTNEYHVPRLHWFDKGGWDTG